MTLIGIVLSILGAVIGGYLFYSQGAAFGLVSGYLFGTVIHLKHRLSRLEKSFALSEANKTLQKATACKAQPEKQSWPEKPEPASLYQPPAPARTMAKQSSIPDPEPVADRNAAKDRPQKAAETEPSNGPSFSDRMVDYLMDFVSGGNMVVRAGLIILFFGVTFLIKFAADRNMFPIELRLCSVALGALVLLAVGWRLRHKRPGYAVLVQGGSMGILFLTVFAAAKMYHLLPVSVSFLLMVCMVTATAILAVFQNARGLAVFGVIGGFLAPVLMSTGQGNHVFLFSYYAFLNAGIFGIAWFKAWRELNLIGFAFTFVIGMTWGYRYYQPAFFASTEPFLILSFLFYAAISVLYTMRQSDRLSPYLDGTLVFSLPVIVFSLQHAMVAGYKYGAAVSAMALSVFYLSAAAVLWHRQSEGVRHLKEAFLGIGVVFASLAIPLTFNSTWTSCLWTIKGAGLVWIGLRQQRLLARSFGLLLQLVAGISFIASLPLTVNTTPVLNGLYMTCFIISISAMMSHYLYGFFRDQLKVFERSLHIPMIIWGLAWWFAGGINEIAYFIPPVGLAQASLVFISLSCLTMGWLSHWLQWEDLKFPPMGLMPVATAIAAVVFISGHFTHPFSYWGGLSWAVAILSQYTLLWLFEEKWDPKLLHRLHQLTVHLIIFLLTWETAGLMGTAIVRSSTWESSIWTYISWGAVPALLVTILQRPGRRIFWPVTRFSADYQGQGLIPVMGYLLCWITAACFKSGNPSPLTYLPLINPMEMVQLFALVTVFTWWSDMRQKTVEIASTPYVQLLPCALGATAFLLLNTAIARTVHFWAGVSFTPAALYDSVLFQATLSIAWTITALGVMVTGSRKRHRYLWFSGAVLLGIVVGKLFLIDLASIGTIARIISFLAVGLLMLVIGYFTPLPPRKGSDAAAAAHIPLAA